MPPVVIDVRRAHDSRDVVHRAVQALVEGQIVAFPTETVYGLAASALNEPAVCQLLSSKSRKPGHPVTLAIKSADEALDYVPRVTDLARRLARRCWPGPVTLVMDDDHPESLLHRLPAKVREAVSPNGTIGLRVPGHRLVGDVLELLAGPVVLSSANRSGEPDAVTAQQVVDSLGDEIALVLDDGRCQFGQPSSVVRVSSDGLQILRAGVVSEQALQRLSSYMIVLVCTGNTCRSPMAEMLCRRHIARRIDCDMDELDDRGVIVLSAGVAAMAGGGASPEAVSTMAEQHLDLSQHAAQPLTDRLVLHADLLLTMTNGHRAGVVRQWPEAAAKTLLLSPDGQDVADPIGGSTQVYRQCAKQIDDCLTRRLEQLRWDEITGI